jgi:ferrochelatase
MRYREGSEGQVGLAAMSRYRPAPTSAPHPQPLGLLLANLGTPEAPTPRALRRYLRQFLSDQRVVEQPRLKWWLVLNLFILTTRPRQSARLYEKVWTAEGSPLLRLSQRLSEAVGEELAGRLEAPVAVELGMRYGEPSVASALARLEAAGCRRLLCLPLFPQYSATTTASVFDAVFAELAGWRVVPELRTVAGYWRHPGYVEALAASIAEQWRRDGEPEHLLLSFHGIPVRYAEGGDPYPEQCRATARRLAAELGVAEERWTLSFQSVFGKEPWISPATDATVRALARRGVGHLDVVCPGFATDCLETLEEIDQLNRRFFLDAGGRRFRYLPCLNDRDDHARLLAGVARHHLSGWAEPVSQHAEGQSSAAMTLL